MSTQNVEYFETKKGTKLPFLNLRGKPYLQVAHRLVWFREDHPDWSIETEVQTNGVESMSKAIIRDEAGRIIATAHKKETAEGFGDHLEKSETGSIGRALALIGYGTQFAPELDEGERLADSPIQRPKVNQPIIKKPVLQEKPLDFNKLGV